ncbi:MAG TPA: ribonuclease E inhibitor RraB [Steroidobacteraceae bacterium]|nr:ribonuclease E inhibitor RraB [Gammaproteobacteria bacterium]HEV2285134.1 ribonuclease E inhibitor RraB [Steroidobacteraceae bacterium]
MSFFAVALAVALVLIVARVYFKLRAAARNRVASWDAQLIDRLRARGYVPFNDYPVDFFIALPDEAACQRVRARLEPEFSVDIKPMQEAAEFPLSLHATKTMRLILPDMQALSARMSALAVEFQGRYDGWAA